MNEIRGDLKPAKDFCETEINIKQAKNRIEPGFDNIWKIEAEKLFKKIK